MESQAIVKKDSNLPICSRTEIGKAGRVKKFTCRPSSAGSNGLKCENSHGKIMFAASVIAVGDEILFGFVEDCLGSVLCRKLHSIGWAVSHVAVTQNDIDSVADEVERWKSTNDMVFIYGGFGPLLSDVTFAGIAKAFGVRMAPDEEFEEYLRLQIGESCTGYRNEMAQLPEGTTELVHHERLKVPLVDISQPLSKSIMVFPDLYIGACRESRAGSLIITFEGKDEARIMAAVEALREKFEPGKL